MKSKISLFLLTLFFAFFTSQSFGQTTIYAHYDIDFSSGEWYDDPVAEDVPMDANDDFYILFIPSGVTVTLQEIDAGVASCVGIIGEGTLNLNGYDISATNGTLGENVMIQGGTDGTTNSMLTLSGITGTLNLAEGYEYLKDLVIDGGNITLGTSVHVARFSFPDLGVGGNLSLGSNSFYVKNIDAPSTGTITTTAESVIYLEGTDPFDKKITDFLTSGNVALMGLYISNPNVNLSLQSNFIIGDLEIAEGATISLNERNLQINTSLLSGLGAFKGHINSTLTLGSSLSANLNFAEGFRSLGTLEMNGNSVATLQSDLTVNTFSFLGTGTQLVLNEKKFTFSVLNGASSGEFVGGTDASTNSELFFVGSVAADFKFSTGSNYLKTLAVTQSNGDLCLYNDIYVKTLNLTGNLILNNRKLYLQNIDAASTGSISTDNSGAEIYLTGSTAFDKSLADVFGTSNVALTGLYIQNPTVNLVLNNNCDINNLEIIDGATVSLNEKHLSIYTSFTGAGLLKGHSSSILALGENITATLNFAEDFRTLNTLNIGNLSVITLGSDLTVSSSNLSSDVRLVLNEKKLTIGSITGTGQIKGGANNLTNSELFFTSGNNLRLAGGFNYLKTLTVNSGTLYLFTDVFVKNLALTGDLVLQEYNLLVSQTINCVGKIEGGSSELTTSNLTFNGATGNLLFKNNYWFVRSLEIQNGNISLGTDATVGAGNLTIANNGKIDIAAGKALVTENASLNGNLCVTLRSTESATAALLVRGNTTGTYTAKMERYIPANGGYHFIATPFNNTKTGNFKAASGSTFLKKYVNSTNTWTNILSLTEAMTRGVSYMEKVTVNSTVNLVGGTFPAGEVSTGLITSAQNYTAIGNPYPCPLNFEILYAANTGIQAKCWFYIGTVYGVYDVNTHLGTNNATRYIPVGQGCLVKRTTGSTFSFSGTAKVKSTQNFYKNATTLTNLIRFKVSNSEGKGDESIIAFKESESNEVNEIDSRKLFGDGSVPEIFTSMNGSYPVAINVLGQYSSVDMSVKSPSNEMLTLTASDFENFDASIYIYLEDKVTGKTINIRNEKTYTFAAVQGENNRFVVHFSAAPAAIHSQEAKVNIYAVDNNIFVSTNESFSKGEIRVYNILGAEILRTSLNESFTKTTLNAQSGTYVVKVFANQQVYTQKVVIR